MKPTVDSYQHAFRHLELATGVEICHLSYEFINMAEIIHGVDVLSSLPCHESGVFSFQVYPTVSADILLQLGYLFQEVGGRICILATVKPFTP